LCFLEEAGGREEGREGGRVCSCGRDVFRSIGGFHVGLAILLLKANQRKRAEGKEGSY